MGERFFKRGWDFTAVFLGNPPPTLDSMSDDELAAQPPLQLMNSILRQTNVLLRLVNDSTNVSDCEEVLQIPQGSDSSRTDTIIQTRPSIPVVDTSLLTSISINLDGQCTALMGAVMRSVCKACNYLLLLLLNY